MECMQNQYSYINELHPKGIWTHAQALTFKQRLSAALESEGVFRDDTMGYWRREVTVCSLTKGLACWCTRHQHQLLLPLSSLMSSPLKLSGWRYVAGQS